MRVESIMAETELLASDILNYKRWHYRFNKNATSSSAIVYINKKKIFSKFLEFQIIEKQYK